MLDDAATQISDSEVQAMDLENLLTEQMSNFNLQGVNEEAPTEISTVMQYMAKEEE